MEVLAGVSLLTPHIHLFRDAFISGKFVCAFTLSKDGLDLFVQYFFLQPKAWLDALKEISVAELPALRERALLIVGNLIANSQEAAEAITQCEILEILMATSMLTGPENKKFKDLALRALRAAYKKKLIAPNPTFEEIDEDS